MNSPNATVRYSDKDLAEFKIMVDVKLEKARNSFNTIMSELIDLETNEGNRFNDISESSLSYQRDYLSRMADRQKRFIRDLENALSRIRYKTYGICVVTKKLIDKRRLVAVPHTTKSIQAKMKQA